MTGAGKDFCSPQGDSRLHQSGQVLAFGRISDRARSIVLEVRLRSPGQIQPAGLFNATYQGFGHLRALQRIQELRAGRPGPWAGDERHRLPRKSADLRLSGDRGIPAPQHMAIGIWQRCSSAIATGAASSRVVQQTRRNLVRVTLRDHQRFGRPMPRKTGNQLGRTCLARPTPARRAARMTTSSLYAQPQMWPAVGEVLGAAGVGTEGRADKDRGSAQGQSDRSFNAHCRGVDAPAQQARSPCA